MNTAHRLADGFRSVISYWTPTPITSQFVDKGTLTPQEFIEAGDQLTFKFPTWKWERADGRRQVAWLPPDKQYLATYGVSSRCRVKDLDKCVDQTHLEPWDSHSNELWLIPSSPMENSVAEGDVDASSYSHTVNSDHHKTTKENCEKKKELSFHKTPTTAQQQLSQPPSVVCFSEIDDILNADEDTAAISGTKSNLSVDHRVSTRSYDLSVTYDKYYQTPRLWLKGYNEQGLPLESSEIFEDILTDYVSKTVTIDPHPCTGELTVSIHPCKHAAVMKKVVNGWISHGIKPRHDLALVVLLKFISSVIPTIQYDTTVDIYGFAFGPL